MNQFGHSVPAEAEAKSRYAAVGYDSDEFIDLERIIAALLRNRWLILAVVAAVLAAGVIFTMLSTRIYTAEASVQIDQQADRILDTEAVQPTVGYQDTNRFLKTQLDILESRRMALKVAESEGLSDDEAFLERAGITFDEGLTDRERERVLSEAIVGHLGRNVSFSLPSESRIARIAYSDSSAAFAAKIANSFAENFINDNLQRRLDSSSYARKFLSNQLAETKARLEESERDLNNFALASSIVRFAVSKDGSTSDSDTVTSRSLSRLNDAAINAEAARAEAAAHWNSAASLPASQLPEVVANNAYQSLQAQRAKVLGDLNQELSLHQDGHPSVQALRAQLQAIDTQSASIANGIKASIKSAYDAASQLERTLKSRVNGLKGELIEEDGRSVRYGILAREVDTNRVIYDGLLQRYKEVSAQAGITNNNISLVDRAIPPLSPSRPKPFINLMLALVVGLSLAGMITFLREVSDDVIRTPTDVEQKLRLPTIGLIPIHKGEESIETAILDPKSVVMEAIHSLRTGVILNLENLGKKTLLVTSSEPAEGKSTTTMALARDLAQMGRRTLLIDADLRRPRMHKLLDVSNLKGLADLVTGSASPGEVIHEITEHGFSFLPAGPTVLDSATILTSERLAELLRKLEENFDIVIIDCAPVLGLADAPILASKVGGILFVVESARGRARSARHALQRLADAGGSLIGIVLTKVDADGGGYGYGYGYGQDYYTYRPGED